MGKKLKFDELPGEVVGQKPVADLRTQDTKKKLSFRELPGDVIHPNAHTHVTRTMPRPAIRKWGNIALRLCSFTGFGNPENSSGRNYRGSIAKIQTCWSLGRFIFLFNRLRPYGIQECLQRFMCEHDSESAL